MFENMHEKLTEFVERLKADPAVSSYNEAETKLAVILPLLQCLGWNRDNPNEVKPECLIGRDRVDFSLRLDNSNKVFLEVKQTERDLENCKEQLLKYAFQESVKLAVLTNGMVWWFYLPMADVTWEKRKFYAIDIKEQEMAEIISKFVDILAETTEN